MRSSPPMRYGFATFTLDTDARQLSSGGRALHLSGKAFDLLTILVEERPRAVDKRELHDRLWPDTFVGDGSLPVLVREIRSALGSSRKAIRTVHRFGYAFAVDVHETSSPRSVPETEPVHLLIHADREFRLSHGENVIGRDLTVDVCIPSPRVSRRHAVITIEGESATLADLKSKNGTRIDGVVITDPSPLHTGCVISFGAIELLYRCFYPNAATETLTT